MQGEKTMNDVERIPAQGEKAHPWWWYLRRTGQRYFCAFLLVFFVVGNAGERQDLNQVVSLLVLCCIFTKLAIIDSKLRAP